MRKIAISQFNKNVFTLFSGTLIAQIIPIAISPLLSRIYSPADFGVFTYFTAISSILATIVTGRYEIAVLLPKEQKTALEVVMVALYVACGVSMVTALFFLLFGGLISQQLGSDKPYLWLHLVFLVVFMIGLYKVFFNWFNRVEAYKMLSVNRVYRSVLLSVSQVAFGLIPYVRQSGLIFGQFVAEIFATTALGWKIFKSEKQTLAKIDQVSIKAQAVRYIGYPKYSMPADLINVATNQIPVFLFASYFGNQVVGLYGFAIRILGVPISLIASSVLDVFKQRASADFVTTGSCRAIFVRTLKNLVLLSIVPFIVLAIISPFAFEFVFGPQWKASGEYTQILCLLFFVRFVASPLSYVLYITEKQKVDLFWQIALCITTMLSIGIGIWMQSFEVCLWSFSVSYSVMYVIYVYLSYLYSGPKLSAI